MQGLRSNVEEKKAKDVKEGKRGCLYVHFSWLGGEGRNVALGWNLFFFKVKMPVKIGLGTVDWEQLWQQQRKHKTKTACLLHWCSDWVAWNGTWKSTVPSPPEKNMRAQWLHKQNRDATREKRRAGKMEAKTERELQISLTVTTPFYPFLKGVHPSCMDMTPFLTSKGCSQVYGCWCTNQHFRPISIKRPEHLCCCRRAAWENRQTS